MRSCHVPGFSGRPMAAWQFAPSVKRGIVMATRFPSSSRNIPMEESRQVLESFFYGKAFAETLNSRLGDALADLIADVSAASAERERALKDFQAQPVETVQRTFEQLSLKASRRRDERLQLFRSFQEEVQSRAEKDMMEQMGATVSPRASEEVDPSKPPPIPDVQETVDDVRADIAATRSALQSLRLKNADSNLEGKVFRRPSS